MPSPDIGCENGSSNVGWYTSGQFSFNQLNKFDKFLFNLTIENRRNSKDDVRIRRLEESLERDGRIDREIRQRAAHPIHQFAV